MAADAPRVTPRRPMRARLRRGTPLLVSATLATALTAGLVTGLALPARATDEPTPDAAVSEPAVTPSAEQLVTTVAEVVTPAPVMPMVRRVGAGLYAGDQPFRFLGYQIGLGASPERPICGAETDAQLRELLDRAKAGGANAVRSWMLRSYTDPGDWTRFDLLLSEARARGLRVIVTLTNEAGGCETAPDGTEVHKRLPWYQSGYRTSTDGFSRSFRDYARVVAERYRDEPAVLAWQLVNEADTDTSPGNCDEAAGREALRAFADDVTSVIRSTGDQHLVSLGTIGSGQCGAAGSADYRYVHAGLVDLCEVHTYESEALPGDEWNGLRTRLADCAAVGKPLFLGEKGLPRGLQPGGGTGAVTEATLAHRAVTYADHVRQELAAGAAGAVVWSLKRDAGDEFAVYAGDPLEPALAVLSVASGISPWAAAAIAGAVPAVPAVPAAPAVPAPDPVTAPVPIMTPRVVAWHWAGLLPRPGARKVTGFGLTASKVLLVLRTKAGQRTDLLVRDAAGRAVWSRRTAGPTTVSVVLPRGAARLEVRSVTPGRVDVYSRAWGV